MTPAPQRGWARAWSESEERVLRAHWPTSGRAEDVAAHLPGRTIKAIRAKAAAMCLNSRDEPRRPVRRDYIFLPCARRGSSSAEILARVSQETGVPVALMTGVRRTKGVVAARTRAIRALALSRLPNGKMRSVSAIGRVLRRDHSSICYHLQAMGLPGPRGEREALIAGAAPVDPRLMPELAA